MGRNLSLNNENRPFGRGSPVLPEINFRDKKHEIIEKESQDIIKSLRQFKTLKDINDMLFNVPHLKPQQQPLQGTPSKVNLSNNADSRLELLSIIKSPRGSVMSRDISFESLAGTMKPKSLSRLERQIESYHTNAQYQVGYNEKMFEKFSKMKEDVFNLNRELYANVKSNDNQKLILYLGEGPSLVKIFSDKALYLGGISVLPTKNVLLFDTDRESQLQSQTTQTKWTEYFPRSDLPFANKYQEELFEEFDRHGHSSFSHNERVFIFGGGKGKQTAGKFQRDITSDLLIYDYHTQELFKHKYDKSLLQSRMYHCCFVMDNFLYSIGGQTVGSRIIDQGLLEIDLNTLAFKNLQVENKRLMPILTNQKCCVVFYKSRFGQTPHEDDPSSVQYKRLQVAANYSEVEYQIKEEGVYYFGGKDSQGLSNNTLVVMKISVNPNGVVSREYKKPETKGQTPVERYMHSFDYYR